MNCISLITSFANGEAFSRDRNMTSIPVRCIFEIQGTACIYLRKNIRNYRPISNSDRKLDPVTYPNAVKDTMPKITQHQTKASTMYCLVNENR